MTASADVIVVGAGPAGATTALLLARAGRRVALIDRVAFPRDKACGDLVGTFAIGLLRELEIDLEVLNETEPLAGAFVYAPDGGRIGATVSVSTARRFGARVIQRSIFDAALVRKAVRAGVTLLHARVTNAIIEASGAIAGVQFADGSELRAPLTIGADGWSSVVARTVVHEPRVARDAGIAVRVYLENANVGQAMRFYIGARGDGYGWIFPLSGGGANVGLGFVRNEPGADALHSAFGRFLGRHDLRGAHERGPRKAWPIPFGWRGTPVSGAGALLVGDAASLASSLSGSGIHTAIASAALAARTANDALERSDFSAAALHAYDRRLRPIANRLRFERWLHHVAGTGERSKMAIGAANAMPGAGRIAVGWLLSLG